MYKFLHNPRSLRPHGNMPNMLAGLSADERGQAGWELAGFLSSLGGPLAQETHGTSQRSIESGRQLFHSVGCVACHRPLEDFLDLELSLEDADEVRRAEGESADDGSQTDPLAVPGLSEGTLAPRNLDIPGLASMTSVSPLTEFLLDPLSVRASGLMPDMGLTRSEAEDIAVYLLRGQLAQEPVEEAPTNVEVRGNGGGVRQRSSRNVVKAHEDIRTDGSGPDLYISYIFFFNVSCFNTNYDADNFQPLQ